jgi:putative transcriptional regulator
MALDTSLTNHLLIAMPSHTDQTFAKSVIYICEHQIQGTVGLIINRPMRFPLGLVFDQLNIEPIQVELNHKPLLFGGPVQPERGFVIHRPVGEWRSSLALREGVTITTSNDIIRAIAQNNGPKDVLVTLGYVGWGSEQLDKEILDNAWLVCPYSPELLYDVPFEERWEYAGLSIGVKMNQLISSVGHA